MDMGKLFGNIQLAGRPNESRISRLGGREFGMDGKNSSTPGGPRIKHPEDKTKKAEKRKELGRALRIAYQDVLDEPLPNQFSDLLKKLDEVSEDSSTKSS